MLREIADEQAAPAYPSLSVVAPARDEERAAVGESVRSMLAQDFPGPLKVVAVDDRSTDRPGAVLEKLGTEYPERMRVLRVENLPQGCRARPTPGSSGPRRRGDRLLFTDADVRFAPDCFRHAIGYAAANGPGHLALAPEIVSEAELLGAFVAAFEMFFVVSPRPWRAKDPKAKEHVGIGAFKLVRRGAYDEAGTHRAIRMRPDDDMKLAKLPTKEGFGQDVASGAGLVSVEWRRTLRGRHAG